MSLKLAALCVSVAIVSHPIAAQAQSASEVIEDRHGCRAASMIEPCALGCYSG